MNKSRILTLWLWRNQGKFCSCRYFPSPKYIVNQRELHLSSNVCNAFFPRDDKIQNFGELSVFDEIAKNQDKVGKKDFKKAVQIYLKKESVYRRGSVEFILSALKQMKKYDAVRDLMSYKMLISVFPKDKMVAKTFWQSEMMHYPKQQNCAIEVMEQMERNGVIPDEQFGDLLNDRFGYTSYAFKKYRRLIYWLPKFKNSNPYPLPEKLLDCPKELAEFALRRMSIDYLNKITIWETSEMEQDPSEDTFIASAMSPDQQKLIARHPASQPLFVEGYYTNWLRYKSQHYFILRADPQLEKIERKKAAALDEELFEWSTIFDDEHSTMTANEIGIHEQEHGTILGMCITGTASKNSVMTWVKYLQEANPNLTEIPIVFSIRTPMEDSQLEIPALPEGSTKRIQ